MTDDELLAELAVLTVDPAAAPERILRLDPDDVATLLVVACSVLHRALPGALVAALGLAEPEPEPEPAFLAVPAAHRRRPPSPGRRSMPHGCKRK